MIYDAIRIYLSSIVLGTKTQDLTNFRIRLWRDQFRLSIQIIVLFSKLGASVISNPCIYDLIVMTYLFLLIQISVISQYVDKKSHFRCLMTNWKLYIYYCYQLWNWLWNTLCVRLLLPYQMIFYFNVKWNGI